MGRNSVVEVVSKGIERNYMTCSKIALHSGLISRRGAVKSPLLKLVIIWGGSASLIILALTLLPKYFCCCDQ